MSDIHYDIRDHFRRHDLDEYVDAYVLSFEHGCQKPDAEMFTRALDALGVTADRALMVGDTPSHDGGATEVGIPTLHLARTRSEAGRAVARAGLDAVLAARPGIYARRRARRSRLPTARGAASRSTRSPSRARMVEMRIAPVPASATSTGSSEQFIATTVRSPRCHAQTRSSELGSVAYDAAAQLGHRVAQADQVAREREHRVGIVALVGHVARGDVAVGQPRLDARRRCSPRPARRSTASACAPGSRPTRAPWNTPTGSSTRSSGISVSGMPISSP